jgi:hypothetical protein
VQTLPDNPNALGYKPKPQNYGFKENHFRGASCYFGGVVGLRVKFEKFAIETLRKLGDPGLLLVGAKKNGKCNVMTIGWGFVGVLWRKPVFVVAVRPSRFTHDFIEDAGEFTVNVPGEGMDKAVAYCGGSVGAGMTSLRSASSRWCRARRFAFLLSRSARYIMNAK